MNVEINMMYIKVKTMSFKAIKMFFQCKNKTQGHRKIKMIADKAECLCATCSKLRKR